MRSITMAAVACLIAPVIASAFADQKVRIVVRIPANTPKTESIYLAGSLPSTGGWKADGVKLTRQDDGTYAGDVEVPIGASLEFKITCGAWATVEKNADGSDRPNRRAAIDATTKQLDATVEGWASDDRISSKLTSAVTGNLKLHTIDSRSLKHPRTIRVWLPPGYESAAGIRYPVLYMHDGQNCFDRATSAFGNEWEIDETLTKLIQNKRISPLIVVGIDNGLANRISELTYTADSEQGGGHGSDYAEFLLTEVKPFLDKTYRTQPGCESTFLGGSSLGGLASLEIAHRHPDTFAGVIAMSPTLLWANQSLTTEVEHNPGGLKGVRVWIDMGAREGEPGSATDPIGPKSRRYIEATRRLDEALSKQRIEHRLTIDDQHAQHNEPAWASRFPQAIEYILDQRK